MISKQAEEVCSNELKNCAAVSMSIDGTMRLYNQTDLTFLEPAPNWTTLIHLRRQGLNRVPHFFQDLNLCCPVQVRLHYKQHCEDFE